MILIFLSLLWLVSSCYASDSNDRDIARDISYVRMSDEKSQDDRSKTACSGITFHPKQEEAHGAPLMRALFKKNLLVSKKDHALSAAAQHLYDYRACPSAEVLKKLGGKINDTILMKIPGAEQTETTTLLLLAIDTNNASAVASLLQAKASADGAHLSMECSPLVRAFYRAAKPHYTIVNLLVAHGAHCGAYHSKNKIAGYFRRCYPLMDIPVCCDATERNGALFIGMLKSVESKARQTSYFGDRDWYKRIMSGESIYRTPHEETAACADPVCMYRAILVLDKKYFPSCTVDLNDDQKKFQGLVSALKISDRAFAQLIDNDLVV